MPSKATKAKIRASSHFLAAQRQHHTLSLVRSQKFHEAVPIDSVMDRKLRSIHSVIQLHNKNAERRDSVASTTSPLRRISLMRKAAASHALQNHEKKKQSIQMNAPTSPVHVVSKTRELSSINNKTTKDKQNIDRFIKILEKSSVFESLSHKELEAIVLRLQVTTFIPGEYLMRQGSFGDSLYLIENGKVQITRTSPNDPDTEIKLKVLGSGVLLGEIALLTDGQRTASVYAISKVRCLYMNRETFESLIEEGLVQNLIQASSALNSEIMEREVLEKVQLFKSLTQEQRTNVLDVMGRRVYKDGDVIIKQNDKADFFYVIVTGQVRVTVADAGEIGGQRQVKMYRSNDYFGDTGLLYGAPRSASCIAVGNVRCLSLHKINFMVLIPETILKHLDANGILGRIGDVLKENQAIRSSHFVSDFSRRATLASTMYEARNISSDNLLGDGGMSEGGGAGSTSGAGKRGKKSRRKSVRSTKKKKKVRVYNGASRLRETIRSLQHKGLNYKFVENAFGNMMRQALRNKDHKTRVTRLQARIHPLPHKNATKIELQLFRDRCSKFMQQILLDSSIRERSFEEAHFIVECIKYCQSFSSLTRMLTMTQLEEISRNHCTWERSNAMEEIFAQGPTKSGTPRRSYMILSGGVRIIATAPSGSKSLVAILKPGDSFGELGLKGIGVRPHGAVTTAESEFLVITRESTLQVLGWGPRFHKPNIMEKHTLLLRSGLFTEWAQDHLLQFSLLFNEKVFKKGSVLFQQGEHATHVVIVLEGSLSIRTRRNTFKRDYAPSKQTPRPSSAIRRASSTTTLRRNQQEDVEKPRLRVPKFGPDYDLNFGLSIANLGAGAVVGLGISSSSGEPYTAIASSDTAALVLSREYVKGLILGKAYSRDSTTAATKVRHRQCAAAMRMIFLAQCKFADKRSRELAQQLKRSQRFIHKAVTFREREERKRAHQKALTFLPSFMQEPQRAPATITTTTTTAAATAAPPPPQLAAAEPAAEPATTEPATTEPAAAAEPAATDQANGSQQQQRRRRRPATAGPKRLRPIEKYKKRDDPREILKNSVQALQTIDKLAAAKLPQHNNDAPRFTSTTEYWSTVRRRNNRPTTAPSRRRNHHPNLMSMKDYTSMREQRLKEAILGERALAHF